MNFLLLSILPSCFFSLSVVTVNLSFAFSNSFSDIHMQLFISALFTSFDFSPKKNFNERIIYFCFKFIAEKYFKIIFRHNRFHFFTHSGRMNFFPLLFFFNKNQHCHVQEMCLHHSRVIL